MQEAFEYQGKRYYLRNSMWFDSSMMKVSNLDIVNALNRVRLSDSDDVDASELLQRARTANSRADYPYARQCCLRILDGDFDLSVKQDAFAMFIAAIRHEGQDDEGNGATTSRAAIVAADKYASVIGGSDCLDAATCTSLAACYLDLAEFSSLGEAEQRRNIQSAERLVSIAEEKGSGSYGHTNMVRLRIDKLNGEFEF